MKKRLRNREARISNQIELAVTRAFTAGFSSVLYDINYRIENLLSVGLYRAGQSGKVTSEMLSLATPLLDGFVITDNQPVVGSISWTDCNVVYKGTKHVITNGNTAMKYVYWTLTTTPNTFKTSNTKPVLTDDDILVCINQGGIHQMVIGEGRMVNGAILFDGTIGETEIGSGAVTTGKIASKAISTGLLADGAVTGTQIAGGAVNDTKLASNAVTQDKIASGAVSDVKIATGAVTSIKIAGSAVDSTKLADNAVTTGKIAGSAVDSTKLADSAVTTVKIAGSAVDSTKLADNAVTGPKIGAGAVATDKLSIATHLLF